MEVSATGKGRVRGKEVEPDEVLRGKDMWL